MRTPLAWAIAALLAAAPLGATANPSTFDTDLEDWESWGFDIVGLSINGLTLVQTTGDMVHETPGGNPGGYARLTDAIESPASFARAPSASFSGDLSAMIGGTFTFDHKLFATGGNIDPSQPPFGPYSVLFISGNPGNLNSLFWTSPGPSTATDWESFTVDLDMSGGPNSLRFIQDADVSLIAPPSFPLSGRIGDLLGVGPPTMTFEQIMANVTTILVGFELVNNRGLQNSEHGGIDNVALTAAAPEPAAWITLLLSSAILLRCRARSS